MDNHALKSYIKLKEHISEIGEITGLSYMKTNCIPKRQLYKRLCSFKSLEDLVEYKTFSRIAI